MSEERIELPDKRSTGCETEESLRQRAERYRSIIDEMTDSFWETDLDGRFTFFNNQVMVETMRSREELFSLDAGTDRKYIDEDSLRRIRRAFQQVLTTGEPLHAHFRSIFNFSSAANGSRVNIIPSAQVACLRT
ncbi:MAG TPA: PAS domain S-box protein [Blastocatellia bacterium]